MTKIVIDIGVTGLTNVMALPYSADRTLVWNGTALVDVATATPSFISLSEVMVSGVGSGNYSADLPTALQTASDNGDLWITIYNAGTPPSVSDPLYGYVSSAGMDALIKAVTDAIAQLEINIDPCELRRALEHANIRPSHTVFGPCQRAPVAGRCP